MRLRDIVEINQQGLVADAVNLSMMANPAENLPLCKGFVFNYDPAQPKMSTLGVLDALRESFHSANNANIHLMVQDFGKGKSHFALTVANFFKQPADSPEVAGILSQIKFATSENTQAVYERIKAYKERSRSHLVLSISGETSTDLGKALILALQTALESQGIGDTLAQHFIQDPLNYLQDLPDSEKQQAESFLGSHDNFKGDLAILIDNLREGQYDLIPIVKDLSAHLNRGRAFDFQLNLDIERMFGEVIQHFCTGENRRFEGIIILFDELNAYLRTWLKNPPAAGGYVLQNVTNLCSNHRGKVALLFLAQIKPSLDTQVTYLDRKNYERFTSRIELAPSTYTPESSLELVIDKLLKQSECDQWQTFQQRFENTLRSESRIVYERYIPAYKAQKWTLDKFYKHLGVGCYPLHPMTASLLCQLEFTQGRTVIQFIKEDVAKFIEDTSIGDEITFVRPVQLMDAFQSNFAQQSTYEDFKKAYDNIAASASEEETTVLKAIGLYYLSGDKIAKPNNEKHEEILSLMTGYSISRVRLILDKLCNTYQAVYFNSGSNTYRFYSGFSITDLRRKLEEDIKDQSASFSNLLNYFRSNLSHYLENSTIRGDSFVNNHRLNGDDWKFEKQVFSIDEFERKLSTERTVRGLSERGLIAYFIGQYDQDMQALEQKAEDILAKAPQAVQERVVIAIPRHGTNNLARVLLMKNTLSQKSNQEKQEFGPALTELHKQFDEQLDTGIQEILDSCVYTCRSINKVPLKERKNLEAIVSKMLEELYVYVPPVESQSTLSIKTRAGLSIVSYTARQLLSNDLKEPFPNQSYKTLIETVFIKKWVILKQGRPYTVQVPKDPNVRQAWDVISEITNIMERDQSTTEIKKIWDVLSDAPYGYNELTFTMIFTAWLAYHRGEVELSGGFGIPIRRTDRVSSRSASIHEWAQTNILEKPKDFVHVWIVQMRNKVIRRKPFEIIIPPSVNYDEAISFVEQIKNYLHGASDPARAQSLEKNQKQLQNGIENINTWLQPIQEAQIVLENQPTLDVLGRFYESLEDNPPVIIKDGVTTVQVTEAQINTWRQTRQALRGKLEALVEDFMSRAQSFTSADQGYTLKAEIKHQIQALENIPNLPSRFIDSLKVAQESINQQVQSLQDLETTQKVLEQIQTLYDTLGANASKSQYDSVLANIKKLAEQYLSVQQEEGYLKVIQEIETQQDDLICKLDQWESQFAALTSRSAAYQLGEEISNESNRFDEEESGQRVNSLKERIRARILEQDSEEKEEADLKATVEQSRQKSQSIANSNNIAAAMQFYDSLSQIVLPSTQKISDVDIYYNQLEELKVEGRKAIEKKFHQFFQDCNQEIKRPEEYNQRKSYIARAKSLLSKYAEFSALQDELKVAENTLETKYEDLKKRAEDVKLLRDLQNLRPVEGNTIKRCEEIIVKIEDVRSKLNFAEQHKDAIDRLLNAFQSKRMEHGRQLDELTANSQTVDNINQLQQISNELSKLDLIFRDSAEYERYRLVEGQLKSLTDDLKRITQLESQCQNAQSIATIQQVLNDLPTIRAHLCDSERFQSRLQSLEALLQQRQQQYVEELNQWQRDLDTLSESSNARKLQSRIATKANRYAGSEYEEVYDAVSADLNALTRLLELVDIQKTDTINDCQAEIERLDGWKANQTALSDKLDQRIQSIHKSLIQTQQAIQERERNAAHQQLSSLCNELSQLDAITDSVQKLESAKALLKEVRRIRSQYVVFLKDAQKDILRECEQRCENIQSQDYASQIETLFQQLPKERRIELYQRLSAYLETTTEVF